MNDIDDDYRRASAQDPGQPSESTRRTILAHAAALAAQRAAGKDPVNVDFRRPAANQSSWRPALIGTLAAAGLAGLLITPQFLPSRGPTSSEISTAVSGKSLPPHTLQEAPERLAAPAARSAANDSTAPRKLGKSLARKSQAADGPAAADSEARYYVAPPASSAPTPVAPPAGTYESADRAAAQTAGTASPAASARRNFAVQNAIVAGGSTGESARQKSGTPTAAAETAATLMQAAEAGDSSRLQSLLATEVDVNARDTLGRTALMLAILRGESDAVNLLIAHGADANAADSDGLTPLQAALAGTQPGITAALRRAGAR